MAMPDRTSNSPTYRYGFNGKEKDESGEWGDLTHYDYGFRIYNPGIGKFLSVDPLTSSYPWYTPYQFAGNKPIVAVDLDGLEEITIHSAYWTKKLQELVWDGATAEEIVQNAETYNCHGGGLYGGYQNEESREWAERHYESAGYVTSVKDGHLSITGFSNANDGTVYRIVLTPAVTIQDQPSQSPSGFEGVLEGIGEIKGRVKEKLGDDDSDLTMDEAVPLIVGTAVGTATVLASGGSAAIALGAGEVGWAVFGGVGVVFAFDDLFSYNGKSLSERTFVTSDEAQKFLNGAKTFHAIVGGTKMIVDVSKIGNLRSLAADGNKLAKELVGVVDGLLSSKSAVESVINLTTDTSQSNESENKSNKK